MGWGASRAGGKGVARDGMGGRPGLGWGDWGCGRRLRGVTDDGVQIAGDGGKVADDGGKVAGDEADNGGKFI
ncbi:hypothetical protein TIFTF001_033800 [Ficus carica]|uniref:Uncharacterized protein n=1 Tax=Ficus carica TaxID=3494 RepID=A0AA88DZ95_FICCA|nr:hypothetical protein TIFTF001_033800 [Ficus carica]